MSLDCSLTAFILRQDLVPLRDLVQSEDSDSHWSTHLFSILLLMLLQIGDSHLCSAQSDLQAMLVVL
jgi:hypothetical protein